LKFEAGFARPASFVRYYLFCASAGVALLGTLWGVAVAVLALSNVSGLNRNVDHGFRRDDRDVPRVWVDDLFNIDMADQLLLCPFVNAFARVSTESLTFRTRFRFASAIRSAGQQQIVRRGHAQKQRDQSQKTQESGHN